MVVMNDNGYRVCNPGISLEGPLSEEERKTLERKLQAIFIGILSVAIIAVGYLFNAII